MGKMKQAFWEIYLVAQRRLRHKLIRAEKDPLYFRLGMLHFSFI